MEWGGGSGLVSKILRFIYERFDAKCTNSMLTWYSMVGRNFKGFHTLE